MDETDAKLRRAAELIQEAAGVAVAVGSPLSFGRTIVELLLRLHSNEPLPIVAYERARKDGSLDHRGRRANHGAQGAAFHALREGHLAGALLDSSGCVSAAAIAGGDKHGAAYITPLGELVLRFMGSAR